MVFVLLCVLCAPAALYEAPHWGLFGLYGNRCDWVKVTRDETNSRALRSIGRDNVDALLRSEYARDENALSPPVISIVKSFYVFCQAKEKSLPELIIFKKKKGSSATNPRSGPAIVREGIDERPPTNVHHQNFPFLRDCQYNYLVAEIPLSDDIDFHLSYEKSI
jgi:hypothetical protein